MALFRRSKKSKLSLSERNADTSTEARVQEIGAALLEGMGTTLAALVAAGLPPTWCSR